MPQFDVKVQAYKPPKAISFDWNDFRAGLNTLLKPTELKPNELSQADNLWLVGQGVPTKRPGTANYFMGGLTGSVEMVKGSVFKDGTNELLTVVGGIAAKKSNASYSVIGGASFASGSLINSVMVQNSVYMVNGVDKITKYSGASLIRFNPLSTPTITSATFASGVSSNGAAVFTRARAYSYRVTGLSPIGETLGSIAASLASGPQDPTQTLTRISWSALSAASGDLIGYQIYGRDPGNETFMAKVGSDTLTFEDDGSINPSLLTDPPTANTTDGPTASYIIRYTDKIVVAGISGEPSRVIFSGGGANVDKFHWSFGGGYVDISKDDGDTIKGLASFQDKIIVFKEKSIWQITLSTLNISGTQSIVLPIVKNITNSHGAVSHKSIVAVENDLFFLSRNGVYVLGNEPNIIGDILRTNELSAKIRPTVEAFNNQYLNKATAIYWNYKYILSYPDSGQSVNTKIVIYDRERTSWMGPWNIGANSFEIYYDSSNAEKMLLGDTSDNYITELSTAYRDDKATTISTFLRTRKEDFKDWSLFKTIQDVFFDFRNVLGTIAVNIRLEDRTGETTTAKSFSVSSNLGTSGWGSDKWGMVKWGVSNNTPGQSLNEIIKQAHLVKTARAMQIEVQTSNRNDVYELIGVRADARVKSPGARPSSWRSAVIPLGVFQQSMEHNMTSYAQGSQVINRIIEWIQVNMMNLHSFVFDLAILALIVIFFSYLFTQRSRKSRFVPLISRTQTFFVSWVKLPYSLFSKFLLSLDRSFNPSQSSNVTTAHRAILSSVILNSMWSGKKLISTIKTFGNKTINTIMNLITKFGITTKGTTLSNSILLNFIGKLFLTNNTTHRIKHTFIILLGRKPATSKGDL